jgi:hypothetical protein
MSETINWIEANDNGDFAAWMILVAITKENSSMIYEEEFDSETMEVEFTVNGHEVSFMEVAKRMESVFDHVVEEKTEEIINEKFDNLHGNIRRIKNAVLKELKDIEEG